MELQFKKSPCLLCNTSDFTKLGIRGTREYQGADPAFEPHVVVNVVKCNTCGFVYTNPQVKGLEHLEADHYNNIEKYQAAEIEDISHMFAKRVEIVKKYKTTGSLLDVGAGKGEFLNEAFKAGFQSTGVEPSPEFCKHIEQQGKSAIYCGYLGSVDDLKSQQFDVITMFHVLEHVHDPHSLAEVLKGNLKDDGILLVEVPNVDSLFIRLINWYYRLKGLNWSGNLSPFHAPFHQYGYNAKALNYLFKQHQFKAVEINTLSGRDRGFATKKGQSSLLVMIRNMVMNLVDILGNRELIYIVLKKQKG